MRYDYIYDFINDIAEVKIGDKLGAINRQGDLVIEPIYESIGYKKFKDGKFTEVKKDGKWGIINKKGKVVVDFKYSSISYKSKGIIEVSKDRETGLLDKNGNINKFSDGIKIFKNDNPLSYAKVDNDVVFKIGSFVGKGIELKKLIRKVLNCNTEIIEYEKYIDNIVNKLNKNKGM